MINHGKMDNGPLHPDGHALVKLASEVNRLTARITALEAQVEAADRLAANLADNLTWVLPMAKGYAAANPHDVNRRIVSGAEDDLAAYRAAKGE